MSDALKGWQKAISELSPAEQVGTPRTDAAIDESVRGWSYQHLFDESRKIERELSALRAKLEAADGFVQYNHDIAGEWHAKYSAAMKRVSELEAKLAAAEKDAERLAYLTADHADGEVRKRRNELLCRMPVMSHSATCADIDIGIDAIEKERGNG